MIVSLKVDVNVKMLRETLCEAQSLLGEWLPGSRHQIELIQKLINECDKHRPLGPDGKHGNRHTDTCGCEDKPHPWG